jgi:hypothetical protein
VALTSAWQARLEREQAERAERESARNQEVVEGGQEDQDERERELSPEL